MLISTIILAFLGLASAIPPPISRPRRPKFPESGMSQGFHLVVNITHPDHADFIPAIQNLYLTSIHVGAGQARVSLGYKHAARLFYQNGTFEEQQQGRSSILSDGGTPPAPQGFQISNDKDEDSGESMVTLNAGPGTKDVFLSGSAETGMFVRPETFIACNATLPYYGPRHFIVIQHANASQGDGENAECSHPERCVPVHLVPECAGLPSLPPGAYSSHEFAFVSRCYDDVKSIRWAEVGN